MWTIYTMAICTTKRALAALRSMRSMSTQQILLLALGAIAAQVTLRTIFMAQAAVTKPFLTVITSTISSTVICITRTMATAIITAR
jgi:hypothetical protein